MPVSNASAETDLSTGDSHAELVSARSRGACDTAAWNRLIEQYPARFTDYYVSLANPDAADDPILRQCMPDPRELDDEGAADPDPLAEVRDSPLPGLVHRYPDRVLLIATNRCAVRCRHCLRKRIWADEQGETLNADSVEDAVAYLDQHPEVREVLVSGGDPLTLADARLNHLLTRLRSVPHLEILRIGTRMPVVQPPRITDGLCRMLQSHRPLWVATQFNHPAELTEEARAACSRLLDCGIPIVNQTVLLKGINADADILESLFRGLLTFGVKPYYLFHGDPVRGTLHFRTGVRAGLEIMSILRERLSGLALPAFAVDLPGGEGKVILTPETPIRDRHDGRVELTLSNGRTIHY